MLRSELHHPDGQRFCAIEFEPDAHWLRATWTGFVTAQDGEQGALGALRLLGISHAPCLLNDNSGVTGPWFDSVEWLERVWAPQAQRLGLLHVAHVMQPDANAELAVATDHNPFAGRFELQLFSTVQEAEHWLRLVAA